MDADQQIVSNNRFALWRVKFLKKNQKHLLEIQCRALKFILNLTVGKTEMFNCITFDRYFPNFTNKMRFNDFMGEVLCFCPTKATSLFVFKYLKNLFNSTRNCGKWAKNSFMNAFSTSNGSELIFKDLSSFVLFKALYKNLLNMSSSILEFPPATVEICENVLYMFFAKYTALGWNTLQDCHHKSNMGGLTWAVDSYFWFLMRWTVMGKTGEYPLVFLYVNMLMSQ